MTKKDYELIAEAIAESMADTHDRGLDSLDALYHLAAKLGRWLREDNPRFDNNKFTGYINRRANQLVQKR
jgi:hypothetical protein